jgi:hypothetical protein
LWSDAERFFHQVSLAAGASGDFLTISMISSMSLTAKLN